MVLMDWSLAIIMSNVLNRCLHSCFNKNGRLFHSWTSRLAIHLNCDLQCLQWALTLPVSQSCRHKTHLETFYRWLWWLHFTCPCSDPGSPAQQSPRLSWSNLQLMEHHKSGKLSSTDNTWAKTEFTTPSIMNHPSNFKPCIDRTFLQAILN